MNYKKHLLLFSILFSTMSPLPSPSTEDGTLLENGPLYKDLDIDTSDNNIFGPYKNSDFLKKLLKIVKISNEPTVIVVYASTDFLIEAATAIHTNFAASKNVGYYGMSITPDADEKVLFKTNEYFETFYGLLTTHVKSLGYNSLSHFRQANKSDNPDIVIFGVEYTISDYEVMEEFINDAIVKYISNNKGDIKSAHVLVAKDDEDISEMVDLSVRDKIKAIGRNSSKGRALKDMVKALGDNTIHLGIFDDII